MPLPTPMMPDFKGGPKVFIQEVKTELSRVIWPTKDEVIKLTSVVLLVSIVIGIYIGGLDFILTKFTDFLVKR